MGFLRTENGRLRLLWRVLLFWGLFSVLLALGSLFPLPGLPGQTLPALLAAVTAGWALLLVDGRTPGALGFYLGREVGREAFLGLGLGIVVLVAAILGIVGLGGIWWVGDPGEGGWLASFVSYARAGGSALWMLAIPAAAEEALFRGYLFQALAEGWGALKALWVTSVLFGLIHLGNPNVNPVAIGNIVVAGLFLGVVYLKTASLWWATGAHLGWNWAQGFLADLPVSGLELVDAPLLEPAVRGLDWVSGGAFGPEGSLVTTVVAALATLILWTSPRLAPGEKAMEVRPLILAGGGDAPPWDREDGVRETSDFGRRT